MAQILMINKLLVYTFEDMEHLGYKSTEVHVFMAQHCTMTSY